MSFKIAGRLAGASQRLSIGYSTRTFTAGGLVFVARLRVAGNDILLSRSVEKFNNLRRNLDGRRKTLLAIMCAAIVGGVLVCTLWPFDPFLSNEVTWLSGSNGLVFGNHGVVVSSAPLQANRAHASQNCTLEVLLRPFDVNNVSTILSFYRRDDRLEVKQWRNGGLLVLRTHLHGTKLRETSKLDIAHAFSQEQRVLLTLSSGPKGTAVYLNGREIEVFPEFTLSQSDLSGQIVIGTSAVDYQPWSGEISGLAVYSKELTASEVVQHSESWNNRFRSGGILDSARAVYYFEEGHGGRQIHSSVATGPDLAIPVRFVVPFKPFLQSPVKEFKMTRRYAKDLLVNVAGFVPVGLLFYAYLQISRSRNHAFLLAIIAGALLSVTVELLQAYIPQRGSGVADIITNTAGAFLGATLVRSSRILCKTR